MGLFKKIGAGVKKAAQAVGKGISDAAKGVAKAAVAVGKGIVWAPLIPFRGKMEEKIRLAGAIPKTEMSELCRQFYNLIVKKKNFDNPLLEHTYEAQENVIDDIVSIVKDIIGFFKKSKDKKDAGTGTALENDLGNEVDKVTAASKPNILEKLGFSSTLFKVDVGPGEDSKKNVNKMLLVGGGIAAILIALYVSKKGN